MRVITGTAGGTNLKAPAGLLTRPTADRVKQALFNIIQYEICGDVLDLFAGSGQLGIEALSRGAARAVFVDERRDALDIVRENLRRTHLAEKAELVQGDYLSYLDRCKRRFRLIFLDPPYAEKYLENSLKRISEIDILAEGGIIITERPKEKPLDGAFSGLARSKDYLYGKTAITLFRREEDAI
jgi:16S rRNA (guanine966-N2)-methyltransferase